MEYLVLDQGSNGISALCQGFVCVANNCVGQCIVFNNPCPRASCSTFTGGIAPMSEVSK